METKYENKDICAICKGACCKNGGCDYSALDFEFIKREYLKEEINKGYISITASHCIYQEQNGKYTHDYLLYLRARNLDRGEVDLLSVDNRCLALTNKGCSYTLENRPRGGVNLIPDKNHNCKPAVPQIEIANTWLPYQKILSKLVKFYTGNTPEKQLREDAKKFFIDCLSNNFSSELSEERVGECLALAHQMRLVYPDIYESALSETRTGMVLHRIIK